MTLIIDLVRTSKYDCFLPTLVITDIFQNIRQLFFSIRNMLLFIFQSNLYNAVTIKHAKCANYTHLDLLNVRGTQVYLYKFVYLYIKHISHTPTFSVHI